MAAEGPGRARRGMWQASSVHPFRRADALRRLQESNGRTLFVYPAVFDVIVRAEFKDVEPLLVPIPFGEHTDVTVDLAKRFSLPS